MSEYRVTVGINKAHGTREYLVEADTEREAEDKVLAGEGTLDNEDLTVDEYGDNEVELNGA